MQSDPILLADFSNYESVLGKSPGTISAHWSDIKGCSDLLAGRGSTLLTASSNDIAAYLKDLKDRGNSDRTICRKLSSLHSFYSFAWIKKGFQSDPTLGFKVRKTWENQPKAHSEAVVDQILEPRPFAQDNELARAIQLRDQSILEFIYSSAPRATTVATLHLKGVNTKMRRVKVYGKGGKGRYLPLTTTAAVALEIYLRYGRPYLVRRAQSVEGVQPSQPDEVYLSARGLPLTRQWIWRIVKNRNKDAYPHSLRHSCATHMVEHGAELEDVQELLDHADVTTTMIYAPVNRQQKKDAHRKYHPRGSRKSDPADRPAEKPAKPTRRRKGIAKKSDTETSQ